MKLYNHALAPNPRRVRIFAAEKGIKLSWYPGWEKPHLWIPREELVRRGAGARTWWRFMPLRVSCNLPVSGGASPWTQPLRARPTRTAARSAPRAVRG